MAASQLGRDFAVVQERIAAGFYVYGALKARSGAVRGQPEASCSSRDDPSMSLVIHSILYNSETLAYAAGLNLRWIALITYKGKLEIATMIATLYAKADESTKRMSGVSSTPWVILTKVLGQDSHRTKVHHSGPELAQNHVCVPCCDLQRHHDQFIDDKGCEGDRDDVQKL